MLSRRSVPRIRIDLLDSSAHSLSPSSTLDIQDILSQVQLLPELLTEGFVFNDVDVTLRLEDACLEDVPSFPRGRQPPLFLLNSHRTRLPFSIRPEAFELGDFFWDEEDVCPLLTAPTVPRMKLMIKEQLYVQKWVDTLTSENPPKHIPWTCERPATERKWIAEGSIFPAAVSKSSHEQHRAAKEHTRVTDANRLLALADQVPYSGELSAFSEISVPGHPSVESHRSADVETAVLRGELRTTQTLRRITTTSETPSLPTLVVSGLQSRTTSTIPDTPLAARRGKPLSGLKLNRSLIEQLEYPDIPTAFRGSPGVWSPRFDAFHTPFFTDHHNMLRDLKSKCAALGSGVPTCIRESLDPHSEMIRTSFSVDEWWFTQGLATFDNLSGSIGHRVSGEIVADMSVFLPDGSSTPARPHDSVACLGFVSQPHSSTLAPQSSVSRCSDPPEDPLPPRPALISPSTPPHVRGILKKVKSVRFEDTVTEKCPIHDSPVVSPPTSSLLPPVPSITHSPSSNAALAKEMSIPERNVQEKPPPRSRLPPKRTKGNGKHGVIHPDAGKTPETSPLSKSTIPVGRPCRTTHAKNINLATVSQSHVKQRVSLHETDLRRGIEGTTKSRLSTPLRNIFRFR